MFMKLFQKNKILLVPRFLLVKPWIDLVLANRFGKNFIRLINHPIILGSSIIFLGSIFGNFFNFLFNLFISRNLSIEDYGVVARAVKKILIQKALFDGMVEVFLSSIER